MAARVPAQLDAQRARVCPAGARRGIDVQRCFAEIERLVRAYGAQYARDIDADDLVQEVATAIATRKNASEASAFDRERASFATYVTLVCRSEALHMRAHSRHRSWDMPGDIAMEALAGALSVRPCEATTRPVTPATLGDLIAHLADVADHARDQARRARATDATGAEEDARYHDGVRATAMAARELLAEGFDPEAQLPLQIHKPREEAPTIGARIRALLAVARRPLALGELSAGLLLPVLEVAPALVDLGHELAAQGGRYELAARAADWAPYEVEPAAEPAPIPAKRRQLELFGWHAAHAARLVS